IHRDIKPENIIRRRSDGRLVLVDFGAAKYATGTALGKTGTTIGSAGYAAPEQTFGQAVFSSDIYGLGVTCIHLLTNIEPFELYNVMENAFVWRHHLGKNSVSDQLGRVLDKMTQSIVKQRYQSAEEGMQALGLKVGTQTSKKKPCRQINRKVIQPSTAWARMQSSTAAPVLKTASLLKASPTTTVQKFSVPPRISYENLRLIATLPGSKGSLLSISISPDGKKVASCSGVNDWVNWFGKDDTVRIWDIDSRKLIRSLIGHSWWVYSVAFSPDGETLASGAMDKTVKLWNVHTWQEKHTLKHPSLIKAVTFSPDGHTLASSCDNGDIKLWDVHTWREKYTLKGHSTHSNSIAISPDGQTLAICSSDRTIKLWNVITGQEKHTIHMPKYPESVAFSPNGQFLACACSTSVKLWDVNTWQEKHSLDYGAKFATFSPDGHTIATGGYGWNIVLWDVSTAREICILREPSSSVESVAFSSDGQTLVSGSWDKTIKIWRITR
ncbi:WD40 repeat domain-containing serine/threonine-protein kinase, partial [Trichocoleus sp. ST-U3]